MSTVTTPTEKSAAGLAKVAAALDPTPSASDLFKDAATETKTSAIEDAPKQWAIIQLTGDIAMGALMEMPWPNATLLLFEIPEGEGFLRQIIPVSDILCITLTAEEPARQAAALYQPSNRHPLSQFLPKPAAS